MQHLIYSKFSNDRAEQFRIATKILEDENGSRMVMKEALSDQAGGHIRRIKEIYEKLSCLYDPQDLVINHCEIQDDRVVLDYLRGNTLEDTFIQLFFDEKMDELYTVFDEFADRIGRHANLPFNKTEDFIQIFGDVTFEKELKCLETTDIDMILSNIIVIEDTWNLIDYEWTYSFPIPIRFVLYRSIQSFIFALGNHEQVKQLKLYERFSMDESERRVYEQMEHNFQNYVTGNYHTLNELYQVMGKRVIPVWEAVEASNLKISLQTMREQEVLYHKEIDKLYGDTSELSAEVQRTTKIIQEQTELLNDRERRISELEEAIVLMKKSRVWKLRDKIVKILRRK